MEGNLALLDAHKSCSRLREKKNVIKLQVILELDGQDKIKQVTCSARIKNLFYYANVNFEYQRSKAVLCALSPKL